MCFYATDSFDSESNYAANHAKAFRSLASSFDAFVDGLKGESEVDLCRVQSRLWCGHISSL